MLHCRRTPVHRYSFLLKLTTNNRSFVAGKIFFAIPLFLFCTFGFFGPCYGQLVIGQVYDKVLGSFTSVSNGQSQWLDLDNDNDLDLIYNGHTKLYETATLVYENQGGTFVLVNSTLPNLTYGGFAAGDYDRDGDLDFLASGAIVGFPNTVNDFITAIYRNDGNFAFTKQYEFQPLTRSVMGWFDIDNDEDLDFIVAGNPDNQFYSAKTLLYENTGTGFTEIKNSNLPNCYECALDFADANGDGITDVAMSSAYSTELWLNNGQKIFKKDNSAFETITNGKMKFGDFDNDGDQDIAFTGDFSNYARTLIYENQNGNSKNAFVLRSDIALADMVASTNSGIRWFDYNNDGLLDLLVTGNQSHRLFRNNGLGNFTETMEPAFDPLHGYAVDTGDFDNDGDIDICFQGYFFTNPNSNSGPFSGYFKNTLKTGAPKTNTPPIAPSSATFSEQSFRREVRFSWDGGSDAETPQAGLTYNFYLRNDQKKIVIPNADLSTGFLTTSNPANGFGQHGFVNNVPEGNLYYSVQTIDGGKLASAFSSEKSFFHFNGPEAVKAEIIDATHAKLTWLDRSTLETSFKIMRSTSPDGNFATVATLPANSVTYTDDFTFATETHYYYRITSYDASHTSPYDSLVLVIPTAPTNLVAQSVHGTLIQLSWSDNSLYETGFKLERKLTGDPTFSTLVILDPNTENYEDNSVSPCARYEYRLTAISENGGLAPATSGPAKTNCLPVATNFQKEFLEDSKLVLSTGEFENNYSDADPGENLAALEVVDLPDYGTLLLSGVPVKVSEQIPAAALNNLTFEPDPNFNGTTTLVAYVNDGIDKSADVLTVTIIVISVNDPPAFELPATKTVDEDFYWTEVANAVLSNIPYESDITTYSISPSSSEIVNASINKYSGEILFTAKKDQFGQVEFTVTANDGNESNNTFSRKLNVMIKPVNDPPQIGYIPAIVLSGGEVYGPVLLNITDPDNTLSLSNLSAHSLDQTFIKDSNITFTTNTFGEFLMSLDTERKQGLTQFNIHVTDGLEFADAYVQLLLTEPLIVAVGETISEHVNVYPNPFTSDLHISIDGNVPRGAHAVLVDVLGREITRTELGSNYTLLNGSDIAPGLYRMIIATDRSVYGQLLVVKK
jgi:hypothetical protein